jgi:hypothetical protein
MSILKKRNILKSIALTLIVLLLSYLGYKYYEKPDTTTKGRTEVSFTTNEIIVQATSNDGAQLKQFIEKEIEIEGVIKKISKRNETFTLILGGDKNDNFVICEMQLGEEAKVKRLKVGQYVLIKGVYKGILKDVILLNCILV